MGACIDALHFLFGTDAQAHAFALGNAQLDDVSEIDLALGIVRFDRGQQSPQQARVDSKNTRIAQRDAPLFEACVELLANRGDTSIGTTQQPAVAYGTGRLEAQDCQRLRAAHLIDEPAQGRGFDQWNIAIENQDLALESLELGLRHRHRMPGAAPLRLGHHFGSRDIALGLAGQIFLARAANDSTLHRRQLLGGRQHMAQKAASGRLVQHFWLLGTHTRPKSRRKDDDGNIAHRVFTRVSMLPR